MWKKPSSSKTDEKIFLLSITPHWLMCFLMSCSFRIGDWKICFFIPEQRFRKALWVPWTLTGRVSLGLQIQNSLCRLHTSWKRGGDAQCHLSKLSRFKERWFHCSQGEPVNNKILSEARVFPAGDEDAAKCWKPWNLGLCEPFVRMMGLDEWLHLWKMHFYFVDNASDK